MADVRRRRGFPASANDKELAAPAASPPTPRYTATLIFGSLCLAAYIALFARHARDLDAELCRSIAISFCMSVGAFFAVIRLVPVVARYVLKRNMFGYDINKKGSPAGSIQVPESLGIVTGFVFVVVTILFQIFCFSPDSAWLLEYNAALTSILFMILLGFVDDVLDIPWRVKLLLPSFAALPLLMAYAGHTTIVIPKPLRAYLEVEVLDLGVLYKVYMGLLAVFCTNAVNILAGVNGLEVGQTLVISSAILIHNMMQIVSSSDADYQQAHAFSIYLTQPLVGASLGLLCYNWYPSSVFVGDTYTYFAGMTMAVAGILGHFSETLLLFFLPQIINFVYSIPQLFKWVPCPRHRLPSFEPKTGLLTGSKDMNLVNLFLRWFGRCTERQLCIRLLIFQGLCSGFCFLLRFLMAGWYK
ncbi:hypothetical protein SELMODRAFT_171816 [Selaginella moellendorffii]|uniref:UDP-N-acetylglucosamine--dolichyl-phosphate N-acetylglucosaminephosphotransferase n=1 Tax=Selaginella moellendorffii TaxID=88036 RepID=D8RIT9_SELML|nr:UDP-N-acetylglucosamine--dolichyl-phosphate N-acetylglucosaminephosphotransferase [Selaginella moellendorffii]EFJ27803.1 hypothetical protein SELMODRAFT_171816 [Selaginella moellendorffii]|eukprot:XP_002971205.1 UDP-N-acetylglucosamine--dolichyl-phosphate N-acetylglucosaminephosphotransferase [Selaginella moellendorffii]